MEKLKAVYKTLKSTYSPQGWWPTTPPGKLSPEYNGGPGTKCQQVEVVVGSVLTQNTSWSNAKKSIIELNRKKLPSVNGLVNIPERSLAACIKSSGYYNQVDAYTFRIFERIGLSRGADYSGIQELVHKTLPQRTRCTWRVSRPSGKTRQRGMPQKAPLFKLLRTQAVQKTGGAGRS